MIRATPRPRATADKIKGCHLDRLAVVYVRQSTLQQIERYQESIWHRRYV